MCDPITATIAGAAILGGGLSYAGASKEASAQKSASDAEVAQAKADAQRSTEDENKANQKSPDIASILANNRAAASQGLGATFLTGAGGSPILGGGLSKTTLLGG